MIRGFVESIDEFQVRGWAYDDERPDANLSVQIIYRDESLGRVNADLYREDLAKAGVGRGNHAFILNIENALRDVIHSDIQARAMGPTGESTNLPFYTPSPLVAYVPRDTVSFEGITCDNSKAPVFVLGAARSGTTVVTQALLRLPEYAGEEEGHALDLLAHFSVSLNRFYESKADELGRHTMISRIPQQYFQDAINSMFCELAKRCYTSHRWVEKTPNSDLIHLAPRLRSIWPKATFIFMKRRGIENVRSRQLKFPAVDFTTHCKEWASAMAAWLVARKQLQGSALELDQSFIAQKPQVAAAHIAQLLKLDVPSRNLLGQFFGSERPQRTSWKMESSTNPDNIEWDDMTWSTFNEICGEYMGFYGYSYGSDYLRQGSGCEPYRFV